MKLIFCLSNLFVPATLTLIKNTEKEQVMVYTDQVGMFQFFESLNLDNVRVYHRKELYLKKNIQTIYKYFKKRKRIFRELQKQNFNELYFFHNTFGDIENWIIKKLSKSVKIYHIPIFNEIPFEKKYSLKAYKGLFISLFINGINVVPLYTGERYIYIISNSFFNKINAQKKQISIDNIFIKKLIDEKYDFCNKEIVLLTGSIVESNHVEVSEYIKKINALINTIGADKIVVKPHPRFPNRYGMEKELEMVPSFIPANVLFAKFNIYIGYSTAVLIEAAKEGLTAISLLDYLVPVSKDRRDNYKKYLRVNLAEQGKIHYFSSIKEIKQLKL
jgi:hypothetical protein